MFIVIVKAIFFLSCEGYAGISLDDFQAKMKAHMNTLSKKATASVRIEVLGSGKELFSHQADKNLIPASNAKLITTISALDRLGPGFQFKTEAFLKDGELWVRGGGDPYLVSERLYLLARDIARTGVKNIRSIKIDHSNFRDDYRGLIDWDNSGEPFTALVSATSFNFNSVEFHILPQQKEKLAKVEVGPTPHDYVILRNEVQMVGGARRNVTVTPVKVEGNREVFVVRGTLGRDAAPLVLYASVNRADSYFAHALAALLRKEGVGVTMDFGGKAKVPSGAEKIAEQESLPLLDLVRLFNTYSNNFMTEQVFFALGSKMEQPASIEQSRKALGEFLQKLPACSTVYLENGSGLSWNSRMNAKCFAESLQWNYRDFRGFADLLGGLPVGGNTGTLKSRFKKLGGGFHTEKVRAKTGTLWSKQVVTSLVGFTQTNSGELVLFVFLENDERNDPGQLSVLKDWEDQAVEYIQQLSL
jgi:D-alanyl-D-alanine carboxypeptidase/D-alanyl-D-alanine-endopeptidase (penicillin-binding protein 4)